MIRRRLELIRQTIKHRSFRGSPWVWAANVFCPPWRWLAEQKIISIRECSALGIVRVMIRGASHALYVPSSHDIEMLRQIIVEQCYWWHWHGYELPETRIGFGDVVFDCGAAEGLFTLLHHTRATHTYAIEPLPAYQSALEKTFQGRSDVTVLPCALSDFVGTGRLFNRGISSALSDGQEGAEVCVDTIDHVCETLHVHPTFIKADVEGSEQALLRGAATTIRRYGPRLAVTCYHETNDCSEMVSFLTSLVPDYKFSLVGYELPDGKPIMLHAWKTES